MEKAERQILVTSGFGGNTKQPFVSVQIYDLKPIQMSPAEARDLALNLLSGAEAAEQDAFIIHFFMTTVHASLGQAARVLADFRQQRAARDKEG